MFFGFGLHEKLRGKDANPLYDWTHLLHGVCQQPQSASRSFHPSLSGRSRQGRVSVHPSVLPRRVPDGLRQSPLLPHPISGGNIGPKHRRSACCMDRLSWTLKGHSRPTVERSGVRESVQHNGSWIRLAHPVLFLASWVGGGQGALDNPYHGVISNYS